MKLKLISMFIIVTLCASLCSCSPQKVTTTEFALNTVVTLTAYGNNAENAVNDAMAEIRRIENLLSCHIADSEISKINKSAHLAPVKVSEETAMLLSAALDMSKKTNGAFDISVKPLVDLWDINSQNPQIPSDADIQKALDNIGYKNITIENNHISFKKEGIQIDLGGAAKGYCADRIAEIFKKHGIKNALIDLGGNIFALGKNEQSKPWSIGLQNPSGERGDYFATEKISDKSIVTSGSYERFFEKNGNIYHHILNPKSGFPADSGLVSVSVVSDSSFEADMLSTAVFVMGAGEFQKLSPNFNYIKCIIVDRENNTKTFYKN